MSQLVRFALLREMATGLCTLFYPPHCGGCSVRLEGADQTLCSACQALIIPLPEHLCPICSHPMQGILHCPNCADRRWSLSVIVPGCCYEGLAREMVHRFKYGCDQSLMRPLGDLMLPAMLDPRLDGKIFDAIVPVPLHPLREREREFNQSALLAKRLSQHLKLPVSHLLRRTRATVAQAGFDRKHRLENLEGAFEARGFMEEGMSLLLVDDVTTTGTTLNLCASVLSAAGAGEISAVTVARG